MWGVLTHRSDGSSDDGRVHLQASDHLDIRSGVEMRETALAVVGTPATIVIHCEEVEHIDAFAAQILHALRLEQAARGHLVILQGLSDEVKERLMQSGLQELALGIR